MADHDLENAQESSEAAVRPTVKIMQYWKTALAALATVGAIATCIYFPPAALFLSPAVEFLAGSMSFAGIWAGFAAFGTVVAGVAALTFGVTRLLLEGFEALVNTCCAGTEPENEENDVNVDDNSAPVENKELDGQELQAPVVHRGPLGAPAAAVLIPVPNEEQAASLGL